MSNCSESDNYSNYRDLACAIINDGIRLYKKSLREGYDLSVSRLYLNNRFYQMLVRLILDCTVDEMLDSLEQNYDYSSKKRYSYNRGVLYGRSKK